jgi:hypothetical protein
MTTFRKLQLVLAIIIVVLGASVLQDRLTPHTHATVTYHLAWDFGNIVPDEQGTWVFDTALGYRVTMTTGYITSYSTELIACPHHHNIFDWLDSWLMGQVVFANHAMLADESQVPYGVVESLTNPTDITWGQATLSETRYCQWHYAVGGAKKTTQNMPSDVAMNRLSVYVSGAYAYANEAETAFEITAIFGDGVLGDFATAPQAIAEVQNGALDITLTRRLDTLFDTLDFVNMRERELAIAFLRQLVTTTRVTTR